MEEARGLITGLFTTGVGIAIVYILRYDYYYLRPVVLSRDNLKYLTITVVHARNREIDCVIKLHSEGY